MTQSQKKKLDISTPAQSVSKAERWLRLCEEPAAKEIFRISAPEHCAFAPEKNRRSFASHEESDTSTGKLVRRVVCAPDDGYLIRVYVMPDQKIENGDALFDIMLHDGCVVNVVSLDRGVIKPIAEKNILDTTLLFPWGSDEPLYIPINEGTPILEMLAKDDENNKETASKCTPRPTTVMRKRAEKALAA